PTIADLRTPLRRPDSYGTPSPTLLTGGSGRKVWRPLRPTAPHRTHRRRVPTGGPAQLERVPGTAGVWTPRTQIQRDLGRAPGRDPAPAQHGTTAAQTSFI